MYRNVRSADNIAAKQGAPFMIIRRNGFTVAHIKTEYMDLEMFTSDV